ncbi:Major facilitator superfamily domain general substrate transporter [Penicillium chermesinum]|uniref:Major facilitator superfamily domain general substrate transporter n=1 Tax=Penicillium chermesinum TaxID=63820 RepID=A0A9W9NI66_9EURO|nr:Major facilitator superfamily domain general substrate transporter [Penicillium chermesinum]KAJ5220439.1 Major facilitator superfamily domain general substrate transporter [Penicillium chermesinum]
MDVESSAALASGEVSSKAKYPNSSAVADEDRSIDQGDVLGQENVDQTLAAKMNLVNDAIDEIGFTPTHAKLFCLNGGGYAVDSLILLLQSIISQQAQYQFKPKFDTGLTIAVYVGMLAGALFWGISADSIGRRFAFNVSLFVSSIFTIVAGASPSWIVLGVFTSLSAFGAGGNLVLDTTVFLEYLPSRHQWLLTLMAAWWGWRYVWYTSGAFVFVLSVLRVTIIRLQETPKFLLAEGKDEEAVQVLQNIAKKHNRPFSLTVERLAACGSCSAVGDTSSGGLFRRLISPKEVVFHLKGLYATRKMALSTSLVWFSWLLIGLAYPLYNVFLPKYLATRGAKLGEGSDYITWRNYAINNTASIFGPVLAGAMCSSPWFWGRRGTMIIGALVTMIFFFCYTQVRTAAENLGFTCAISFCLNIYYGTLYAYTPEIFPSSHRGTGNGIAIALNRLMGIVSAIVAHYGNTATSVPIYICACLYIVMAIVAAAMPFEPFGRRSS